MDFFKSVFPDSTPIPTPTPTPSPPSTPTSENPQITPPPTSSWAFGSILIKTIASKSESLIDNYYKDLQEFSSGLKLETSVIRQAASRVVEDLPARLESGAAIAQESLEAVGQAIDNVGSTVSEIIGKDLNFTSNDGFLNAHLDEIDDANYGKDLDLSGNAKPYSRIEAMIRGMQCNVRTYCDEVEESDYGEWKLGFIFDEMREEIEKLVMENGVIKEIFDEVVPKKVDEETFWCRYFYRVDKVVKAEEARVRIVKRAILAEEEEELSWDVDDDDVDVDDDDGHMSQKEIEDNGKGVENLRVDEDEAGVSGTKNDAPVVCEENLEEGLKFDEKAGSEGKVESDFSVISSQRSSHVEDDYVWDEIEDSGYESKVVDHGSTNKRLSASEEDEELTWDIEDDDQPIKS